MRGKVGTWVNSQWKYQATPGQFSVAINTRQTEFGSLAVDSHLRVLYLFAYDEDRSHHTNIALN